LEADQRAVEILQRAGYSKDVMIDALAWVAQSSSAVVDSYQLSFNPR